VCGRTFKGLAAFGAHLPCDVEERQLAMEREIAEHNRRGYEVLLGDPAPMTASEGEWGRGYNAAFDDLVKPLAARVARAEAEAKNATLVVAALVEKAGGSVDVDLITADALDLISENPPDSFGMRLSVRRRGRGAD
jgi:hypothetical protein